METNEYKKIRNLYLHGKSAPEISKILNLSIHKVNYVRTNNNLVDKRYRYYRFIVNYAYNHELSIVKIASKIDINPNSLRYIKRKFGINTKRFSPPNKRITIDIQKDMVKLYQNGMTTSEVSAHFGFKTSKTTEDTLKKYNIKCRLPGLRGRLDYSYFKSIDSHDKAYILGLLYTDGYIYENYNGFGIQLTITDKYLLERIATRLGPSASLININRNNKRKIMPNAKNMARLMIYSKVLTEQVRKFGVIKNKTHDLKITGRIPKKYHYSLLRGVIDGDGCICIAKNGWTHCKFATMSNTFANQISSMFCGNFSVHKQKSGIYNVSAIGGKNNILLLLKKIYENKTDLYLERKYEKVQNQINTLFGQTTNLQCNNEVGTT